MRHPRPHTPSACHLSYCITYSTVSHDHYLLFTPLDTTFLKYTYSTVRIESCRSSMYNSQYKQTRSVFNFFPATQILNRNRYARSCVLEWRLEWLQPSQPSERWRGAHSWVCDEREDASGRQARQPLRTCWKEADARKREPRGPCLSSRSLSTRGPRWAWS